MNVEEPQDSEFVEIATQAEPVAEPDEGAAPEAEEAGDGEEGADGDDTEANKDEAEGESDTEADDETALRDKRGRFKGGAEGRIGELTRRYRDAEREAEHWKGIATRNGAHSGDTAATKPSPDQYEDYGEYVEALTDWKADERERKSAGTNADRAVERAAEARNEAWSAKVSEVSATLPDFGDVVGKSEISIANHVADALMDADRGPELAYHLAQHPDVASRLNEMSPMRAAVELGRIEATLGEAPAQPPARKQTKAPAPITPVNGRSTTTKDPARMSQEEYNSWRKEQLKG